MYCRVSSIGQGREDKVSLGAQELFCRDLCLKQKLDLFDLYTESRSATGEDVEDRPELCRLLADAAAGAFQYLVCYDLTRLHRNMDAGSDIAKVLRKAGVTVLSKDGATDFSQSTSRLVYAVQGWSAEEEEARRIAARTWTAKRTRGQRGEFAFAVSPFGYSWDPKKKKPLPVPEELGTVDTIFELAGGRKLTSAGIADELNGRALCPREKGPWYPSQVRRILGDERYCGTWVTWSPDFRPAEKIAGEFPADDPVTLARPELTPEPAISREVWRRARKSIANHRRMTRRPVQQSFLLSGVLFCSHCGAPVIGRNMTETPRRLYYACSSYRGRRDRDCPGHYVPAADVDALIWGEVERLCQDPEAMQEALKQTGEADLPALVEEIARIDRAIADCDRANRILLRKLADEIINDEDYLSERNQRDRDMAAWRERREETGARLEDAEGHQYALDRADRIAEGIRQRAGDLSLEEQRDLLRQLDVRVEIGCPDAADWKKRSGRRYQLTLCWLGSAFVGVTEQPRPLEGLS
jgi:DNA invertase Pin-like site-specific DNA recombinase